MQSVCPSCGKLNTTQELYCAHCGSSMVGAELVQEVDRKHQATPPPEDMPPPSPTEDSPEAGLPQAELPGEPGEPNVGRPVCSNCNALCEPDAAFCHACGTPFSGEATAGAQQPAAPTPEQLYALYVHRRDTKSDIAAMSLPKVVKVVQRKRKKLPPEQRYEALSDEEIAQVILDHARGITDKSDNQIWLLQQIMDLQQQQLRHLKTISNAAQIWIVLVVLGIIFGCLAWLMGSQVF